MEAKVISIATQKGGVGKTTTARELSAALSQDGKKILLIDFDQQMNLTKYVDKEEQEKSIYNALKNKNEIKNVIVQTDLFDFVSSSFELSKADIEFFNSEDVFLLDDALDLLKSDYDFIIIDNGPQRNKLLQMVYVASDYIISPSDDSEGGADGVINVFNDIEKLKNARVPLSKAKLIGIVFTRFKGNTNINKAAIDILNVIMKEIDTNGFVMTIRDSIAVSESKYMRKSVQEYAPYNNAAMDYRKVVKKIYEYIEKENEVNNIYK